jgi:glycosyltransferase involved in cell wall biosynthesis
MTSPQISVVMPAHNAERYIQKALLSLLNQTLKDFELIVVDDGSTDQTPEILRAFQDSRIRIIRHETSQGIRISRNRGAQESRGAWIAVLDADDFADPDRLMKQLRLGEQTHDNVVVTSWTTLVDTHDQESGDRANWSFTPESYFYTLHFRNSITHSSVLLRKDVFDSVGGYAMELAEDYDLYTKMMYHGRIVNVPEYLTSWRRSGHGVSSRQQDALRAAANSVSLHVLESLLGQPPNPDLVRFFQTLAYSSLPASISFSEAMDFYNIVVQHIIEHAPAFYDKRSLQRYAQVDTTKMALALSIFRFHRLPLLWKNPTTILEALRQLLVRNSPLAKYFESVPKTYF